VKRVTLWIVLSTIGLILLFSYHTSTSGPAGAHAAPGVAPAGVVAESPAVAPPAASPPAGPAPASPAAKAPAASTGSSPAGRASPSPRAVVAPSPKPSPAPQPSRTAATTRTINGVAVDTRYGPVQVQIKVTGRRIVSSDAIVYPTNERRDREINDRAVPQLNDETIQAQSANIDTVSGATYTSDGYRESLQSALDAAHL
jgi:uncharacterized protein with FMN-binding domain